MERLLVHCETNAQENVNI